MADCVDASVEAVESASVHPPLHRRMCEPRDTELVERDHSVLSRGYPTDDLVGHGAFSSHTDDKAPAPSRFFPLMPLLFVVRALRVST